MWALRKKDQARELTPAEPVQAEDAGAAVSADAMKLARALQQQTSGLGREAAEVRGVIDDTLQLSQRHSTAVAELARQIAAIQSAQDTIGGETGESLKAASRARQAVGEVAREVQAIVDSLREVAQAAEQITQIALQTRLVAFNASVEAKRAGESGRGFSVVADAVKDLAGKVEESSKDIKTTVGRLDTRIENLAREIRADEGGAAGENGKASSFHQALAEVESGVQRIARAATESHRMGAGIDTQMQAIEQGMQRSSQTLGQAQTRSESFLRVSEHLMELIANCGVQTADTPYIQLAQHAAARISALLEEALAKGQIKPAALFDENYRGLQGSDPAQHATAFNELTDRLFPQVQEPALKALPKIVFCIAADRNGYISTHNQKYCHPQRPGEALWNAANSRWRRIFSDRTGLASARNTKPFLLQTYRRDMGGGRFVLLKEAAAPITVQGRHWGGLRLAYEF
ncbi:MAG: chemotaxis protein [Aquabacterium sp.]|nr:MAG: chemotaxis protein [Aquabacterium sp.]